MRQEQIRSQTERALKNQPNTTRRPAVVDIALHPSVGHLSPNIVYTVYATKEEDLLTETLGLLTTKEDKLQRRVERLLVSVKGMRFLAAFMAAQPEAFGRVIAIAPLFKRLLAMPRAPYAVNLNHYLAAHSQELAPWQLAAVV